MSGVRSSKKSPRPTSQLSVLSFMVVNFALDNVIVTPHLGGTTFEVIDHQTDIVLADIAAFLKGGKPRFCANPEVLKKR